MKYLGPTLIALALANPVFAQDEDRSFSLWDLLTEMEQMAEDAMPLMQEWMNRLQPQLEALGETIGDWSQYEAPEVLPNGDIIIRRKPEPLKEGEFEL